MSGGLISEYPTSEHITPKFTLQELKCLDSMHKLIWVKMMSRMFEGMAGNFAYSGDIHLFINVVNGCLLLHCEDSAMLRLVMATYISAAHQFKKRPSPATGGWARCSLGSTDVALKAVAGNLFNMSTTVSHMDTEENFARFTPSSLCMCLSCFQCQCHDLQ